jgi:hypothetical protein
MYNFKKLVPGSLHVGKTHGARASPNYTKSLRMKVVTESWPTFWGMFPIPMGLPIIKHKGKTLHLNLNLHRSTS